MLVVSTRAEWGASESRNAPPVSAPWGALSFHVVASARAPWGVTSALPPGAVSAPWGEASAIRQVVLSTWGAGARVGVEVRSSWASRSPTVLERRAPWAGGTPVTRRVISLWDRAAYLPAPLDPWTPPDIDAGSSPAVPVALHFCRPAGAGGLALIFGQDPCEGYGDAPSFILPARAYVTTHTLSIVRLPDLLPLEVFAASLSSDESSFGWQLNATGSSALWSQLAPSPAGELKTVRLTLDGQAWEFVVEGLRLNQSFGDTTVSVTGRSKTVLVSDPYYPDIQRLNSTPVTAQQIVVDALSLSGVSVFWGVTDWLVPTGAWSFTGTPLAVARRVAESIGAVLASSRTLSQLRFEPRYPTLPWNWAAATPDISIAPDAVVTLGYERADRPPFNGVYVSGQNQGVFAHVKRTGTAGDRLMGAVTDPLITHLDAARQRGEAMLGRAGPSAVMTLQLPVLSGPGEPGVIDPGALVEVTQSPAWRGIVRSVSLQIEGTAAVSATQTLTLERHL